MNGLIPKSIAVATGIKVELCGSKNESLALTGPIESDLSMAVEAVVIQQVLRPVPPIPTNAPEEPQKESKQVEEPKTTHVAPEKGQDVGAGASPATVLGTPQNDRQRGTSPVRAEAETDEPLVFSQHCTTIWGREIPPKGPNYPKGACPNCGTALVFKIPGVAGQTRGRSLPRTSRNTDDSDDETTTANVEKMVRDAKYGQMYFPAVGGFDTFLEDLAHTITQAVDPTKSLGVAIIQWVKEVQSPDASLELLVDPKWPSEKLTADGKRPRYKGQRFRAADSVLTNIMDTIKGNSGTFNIKLGQTRSLTFQKQGVQMTGRQMLYMLKDHISTGEDGDDMGTLYTRMVSMVYPGDAQAENFIVKWANMAQRAEDKIMDGEMLKQLKGKMEDQTTAYKYVFHTFNMLRESNPAAMTHKTLLRYLENAIKDDRTKTNREKRGNSTSAWGSACLPRNNRSLDKGTQSAAAAAKMKGGRSTCRKRS